MIWNLIVSVPDLCLFFTVYTPDGIAIDRSIRMSEETAVVDEKIDAIQGILKKNSKPESFRKGFIS